MRGPGAVPGLFALESAMDELAIKLKMDPVRCESPTTAEGETVSLTAVFAISSIGELCSDSPAE